MVCPLILVTGKRKIQQGFTLIELMLVLLLMGIFSTVVVVNLNPERGPTLASQQQELLRYLRHLQQEAVFKTQAVGLVLQPEQLTPLMLSEKGWAVNSQLPIFKRPESVTWMLSVEGELLSEVEALVDGEFEPQVLFFSDGLYSFFRLELSNETDEVLNIENLFLAERKE